MWTARQPRYVEGHLVDEEQSTSGTNTEADEGKMTVKCAPPPLRCNSSWERGPTVASRARFISERD